MCLATAYLSAAGSEPIMRDIAHIRFEGDQLELKTLLGEGKIISGKVLEIDFLASRIIVESHAPTTV